MARTGLTFPIRAHANNLFKGYSAPPVDIPFSPRAPYMTGCLSIKG